LIIELLNVDPLPPSPSVAETSDQIDREEGGSIFPGRPPVATGNLGHFSGLVFVAT
jgi:hypothetical protein